VSKYTAAQVRQIKTHYTKLKHGHFSCMKLIVECAHDRMEWDTMRDVIALRIPCPMAESGKCKNQDFKDGGTKINIYKAVRELGLNKKIPQQGFLPFITVGKETTA
jgi:hypothetical protein